MANDDRIELNVLEDDAPLSVSVIDHDPYYVGAEAKVESVTNGIKVTCKDKSGTTSATVYDGTDGIDGEDGNGIAGVTLNDDYTLTILFDDGTSVTTTSIRGAQGETGQRGDDGVDGADGISPSVSVEAITGGHEVSITDAEGTTTFEVMDGQNGADGQDGSDGADGEDGYSPSASVSKVGGVATITITDKDGTTTASISDGTLPSESDPIFVASPAYGIASADITTWNNKSDFSGDYDDLENKPSIPSKTSDLQNDSGYITGYTETDPTVPSWAKAASKPSYTASEVGALPNTTYIPTKVSDLQNDSGYITGYTETDPTVPSWAKQASKPSYTASEVGAVPTSRKVNGKALSADISLDASDVGALPDSTPIPSKTSELQNDSGFLTQHQDISGKADKVDTDIDSSVETVFAALGWVAPI